jgi:N-acetylmuramoyl-L-alanine amidase
MPDPKGYLFDLPATGRPEFASLQEEWYPGVRDYWSRSTSARIFDFILGIRAVVIHATAGVSSSGAMSVMRDGNASWHWLVPDEDEEAHGQFVWACAPEARAAWHVRNDRSHAAVNGGATKVNHWSLGIEIVNSQRRDVVDPFSEWQVTAAARIVRHCWWKYPNLKQVVSHAVLDPDRRTDPGSHFPWQTFRDQVIERPTESLPEAISRATPMAELTSPTVSLRACCA